MYYEKIFMKNVLTSESWILVCWSGDSTLSNSSSITSLTLSVLWLCSSFSKRSKRITNYSAPKTTSKKCCQYNSSTDKCIQFTVT